MNMDKDERSRYIESLRRLPLFKLEWMAKKIDIERFPDRYQAIVDTISEKKNLQPSEEEKNTAQEDARIFMIVARIRRVYLAFLIIGSIGLLWRIFHPFILKENLEILLYAILWTPIYYGLLSEKGWVIPLIFINSAFSCLSLLTDIFHPAENIKEIIYKALSCLMLFFFFYQILFFSKRGVRRYFGDRGKILFH
jgi:hypothetical protein